MEKISAAALHICALGLFWRGLSLCYWLLCLCFLCINTWAWTKAGNLIFPSLSPPSERWLKKFNINAHAAGEDALRERWKKTERVEIYLHIRPRRQLLCLCTHTLLSEQRVLDIKNIAIRLEAIGLCPAFHFFGSNSSRGIFKWQRLIYDIDLLIKYSTQRFF